jgi:serine/threonine protein kinase
MQDQNPLSPPQTTSRELNDDFLQPPQVIDNPHRLASEFCRQIPELTKRKNWRYGDMIIQWAVVQPKTALLLWVCGELDALPKVVLYYELKDNMLPFTENHLRGIVSDPAKMVEEQWKIGILKNLPRDGGHVEFRTQDTVPLQDHGTVGPSMPSTVKTRTKVRFADGFDKLYYVRKRLEVPPDRARDKTTILAQIKNFHKLDHPSIAKIVASYAQGQVVAFIMPFAEVNLADFLESEFIGYSQSEQILTWIKELGSGLAHIHQRGLEHKNIRPQKILVDVANSRIFFTVFGVCHPMRKSNSQLFAPYSNEPSYIYAAPEVIAGRDVDAKHSDTFSLGAIFLEMVTYAKGRTVEEMRQFRSARSHDNSFHANLAQVKNFIDILKSAQISLRNQRKRVAIVEESDNILQVTKGMLNPDPRKRPTMRQAEHYLLRGPGRRPRQPRRNSLGARSEIGPAPSQSAFFNDLASLQSFYGGPSTQSVYGGE